MADIEAKIKSIKWYHSIDLKGYMTPGIVTPEQHEAIAKHIPQDLTSMSVLDIGCADGYYSFLAERRGASRVLAIDPFPWQGGKTEPFRDISPQGILIAKEILNSKIEYRRMGVYDLGRLAEAFDVVFFFGVYYHLKDPILGFEMAAEKCRKLLIVEGDALFTDLRIMVYEGPPYGDETKAWRLSKGVIYGLLQKAGFTNITLPLQTLNSLYSIGAIGPGQDLMWTYNCGRILWRCWR